MAADGPKWLMILVPILGLLILGGIALVVALLANRRTRVVGAVLLLFAGLVVVVGGGVFLFAFRVYHYGPRDAAMARAEAAHVDAARQALEESRREAEGKGLEYGPSGKPTPDSASARVAPVKPTATVPRPKPPEKASGVLPAIGNSLAKAASETGVARASRSVKKSPGVLVASLRALSKAITKERNRPGSGTADAPQPPAWVDAEPGMVGDVYQMTVMVGPFATRQECDEAQPEALQEVAADYIDEYVGPAPPYSVQVSSEFLQERVVTETWEEERMTDFGPGIGTKSMIRRHVLLKFTKEVQNELKRRQRLWYTGYGLAGVLGVLGLAFAYLKVNLATGGRYRGRLRAAAVAAILAAVVANMLILGK